MSIVIKENTGGDCSICWHPFSPGEKEVNHENAAHKGFHWNCFRLGLKQHPICPVDYQEYDLRSRTEKIIEWVKPALVHAAAAAFFGIGVGAVGTAAAEVVGAGAVAVAGVAAVGSGLVAIGELATVGRAGVAGITAGAAGVAALKAGGVAGAIAAGGAIVGTLLFLGGLEVGIGIDRIRNYSFDPGHSWDIRTGILAGGILCGIGAAAGIVSTPLAAIATLALTGGATAAMLSLVRSY